MAKKKKKRSKYVTTVVVPGEPGNGIGALVNFGLLGLDAPGQYMMEVTVDDELSLYAIPYRTPVKVKHCIILAKVMPKESDDVIATENVEAYIHACDCPMGFQLQMFSYMAMCPGEGMSVAECDGITKGFKAVPAADFAPKTVGL